MSPNRSVEEYIDRVLARFKGVRIRYQFKEGSGTHLIEVTPSSITRSPEFEKFRDEALMEFLKKFPDESLVFVSDDSLAKVRKAEIDKTNIREEGMYQEVTLEDISALFDFTRPSNVSGKQQQSWIDGIVVKLTGIEHLEEPVVLHSVVSQSYLTRPYGALLAGSQLGLRAYTVGFSELDGTDIRVSFATLGDEVSTISPTGYLGFRSTTEADAYDYARVA